MEAALRLTIQNAAPRLAMSSAFLPTAIVFSPSPIAAGLSCCRRCSACSQNRLAEYRDRLLQGIHQFQFPIRHPPCERTIIGGFQGFGESGVIFDELFRDLVDDLPLVFWHGTGVMFHHDLHGAVSDLVHGFTHR